MAQNNSWVGPLEAGLILDAYHRAISRFKRVTSISYPYLRPSAVECDGSIAQHGDGAPLASWRRWGEGYRITLL